MRRAASLNGVKINRETFLRTEIGKYCPEVDSELVIATTPAQAGVSAEIIDKMAQDSIDFETKKCAGLSFLAGIPGGLVMVGTVPADLAQYFAHVMRVEQKLAYLYGWQTFLDDNDEVDDQTIAQLVLLMGVMLEVGSVSAGVTKFATEVAQQSVSKTIERQALTKTFWYNPMKHVLRVIGISVTKKSFSSAVSKAVPVIGGAVSGGLTYASFKPSAERLRKYLRALPVSGISAEEADCLEESELDKALSEAKEGAKKAADVATTQAQKVAGAAANQAQIVGAAALKGAKATGAVVGDAAAEGAKAAGAVAKEGAKVAGAAAKEAAKSAGALFDSFKKRR